MAEQAAEAADDKFKGHKRPHELIPDHIKDREKIEVCLQLSMACVLLCLALFHTNRPSSMGSRSKCFLSAIGAFSH